MNFGKLDRKIQIEKFVTQRTSSGAMRKSWEVIGIFWAMIDFKGGGENFEAKQEQGINIKRFTIRFCEKLKATEMMRIKYNDEYYDILFVDEIERGKYLICEAKRKTIYQEQ